jgi:hypothetical protein
MIAKHVKRTTRASGVPKKVQTDFDDIATLVS